MKTNIIFDFDGTIADTLQIVIDFGNENQSRFAGKTISRETFRNRSMREALLYVELPYYRLPQFVFEVKRHIRARLTNVQLFPGMKELIQTIASERRNLYIMSSNSKENIVAVLKKYDIENCFQAIYSDSSIFGKHNVLNRLFKNFNLHFDECIYVGDEVRDLEACKKSGIDMICVDWGWDNRSRLSRAGAEKIVSSPDELKLLL